MNQTLETTQEPLEEVEHYEYVDMGAESTIKKTDKPTNTPIEKCTHPDWSGFITKIENKEITEPLVFHNFTNARCYGITKHRQLAKSTKDKMLKKQHQKLADYFDKMRKPHLD